MSRHLADAYRRAGGDAELEAFPGVGHAFANFPGPAADMCITRMKDFIGRHHTAPLRSVPSRAPFVPSKT